MICPASLRPCQRCPKRLHGVAFLISRVVIAPGVPRVLVGASTVPSAPHSWQGHARRKQSKAPFFVGYFPPTSVAADFGSCPTSSTLSRDQMRSFGPCYLARVPSFSFMSYSQCWPCTCGNRVPPPLSSPCASNWRGSQVRMGDACTHRGECRKLVDWMPAIRRMARLYGFRNIFLASPSPEARSRKHAPMCTHHR